MRRCFRAVSGFGLIVAASVSLFLPASVSAHTQTSGQWTARYFSRDLGDQLLTHCINGSGSVDPLNIVFRYHGDVIRIFDHVVRETHWDTFPGFEHSPQAICGLNEQSGSYDDVHGETDEAEGHGDLQLPVRAHLRIWSAPHPHTTSYEKWSTAGVHHERWGEKNNRPTHIIDEPCETWERHLANELQTANHAVEYDLYYRGPLQNVQGHPDNGMATRVGGCEFSDCAGS